ncbi:hypothetical protein [uncultured Cohaesibacter sp.]|uniref:hypothetical protein n=1 Tax=uncultured Cohaesibacter sp. TaxID=1002546 RepID=UPI0029C8BBE6|nr:hypothetical protein [uncultured Cohaesibacter sp.]
MAARSTSKSKTSAADSKSDATTDETIKSKAPSTNDAPDENGTSGDVSIAEKSEASADAGASNEDLSAELDARQAELQKREAAIVEKEAELAMRSDALDAREVELEAQNTSALSATTSSAKTERHRFKVLKPFRLKGKRRSTDEEVELTEEEHEDLAAIGAVVEDWNEGVSGTGKDFGFLQTSN